MFPLLESYSYTSEVNMTDENFDALSNYINNPLFDAVSEDEYLSHVISANFLEIIRDSENSRCRIQI